MSNHFELLKENYLISTDTARLNVDVIYQYLSEESYWAKEIPRSVVEQSIANSLCFGVYYNNEQIGFARVITDYATFGYLADVFIIESARGNGLSKWLMECILMHPQLQGLRNFCLMTQDAHTL